MSEKFEEKLSQISQELDQIKTKAAEVYGDAKAARELGQEIVQNKINDAKGDLVAAEERIRIADEKNRSHLASQLLKAQMKLEAKIEDRKNARDKKKLEKYIDANILHMADLYEAFLFLLADAELTVLETIDAVAEYDEKFGLTDKEEE